MRHFKNIKIILFILGLVFFIGSCENNNKLTNSAIGQTKIFGDLEIAMMDLPDSLNWKMAIDSCRKWGDGWRVPTKDELNLIYKNKDSISGFAKLFYWSSTESDTCCAWCFSFSNGYGVKYCNKDNYGYVRPVRTIHK